MRAMNRVLPTPLFLALLSAIILLVFSGRPVYSAEPAESGSSLSNVEEMMAGLSDEQVRQLLIDELKKDAAVAEAEPEKMKGPAFFLARLLGILTKEHDDNTEEVRELFGTLDTMVPDLYRVFVKL